WVAPGSGRPRQRHSRARRRRSPGLRPPPGRPPGWSRSWRGQAALAPRGRQPRAVHCPPPLDYRGRMANRLALETSPYLLQHQHNPVDWFAWGDEAFAEARRLDKPILLSVGYSACHWCHVMERESFEDPAIAAL